MKQPSTPRRAYDPWRLWLPPQPREQLLRSPCIHGRPCLLSLYRAGQRGVQSVLDTGNHARVRPFRFLDAFNTFADAPLSASLTLPRADTTFDGQGGIRFLTEDAQRQLEQATV